MTEEFDLQTFQNLVRSAAIDIYVTDLLLSASIPAIGQDWKEKAKAEEELKTLLSTLTREEREKLEELLKLTKLADSEEEFRKIKQQRTEFLSKLLNQKPWEDNQQNKQELSIKEGELRYINKTSPNEAYLQILKEAEKTVTRKDIRVYLCPALQTVSGDMFTIANTVAQVLAPLVVAGVLSIPLAPILFASIALFITRIGIVNLCVDYNKANEERKQHIVRPFTS